MGKLVSLFIFIVFSFQAIIIAQEIENKSVSVTVYNKNLGVVRDIRKVNLKKGEQKLKITDVAAKIDPTSVHINFDGSMIEQNYQYDLVSMDKILEKYINNNIQLIDERGEIVEGKLLSSFSGQIVLEKMNGGLIMIPYIKNYNLSVGNLPEGLITRPTLFWTLETNNPGQQDIEISYMTKGMKWEAEYVAVLNEDDTQIDLNAWVNIENNSGMTFEKAKLKLIAGDINQIERYKDFLKRSDGLFGDSESRFTGKEFFEYHLYTLKQPTTLADKENKQVALFEVDDIKVEKIYSYYNRESQVPTAKVKVRFKNKKENNLGIPMPKGRVRMYKSDGESLQFLGDDWIYHTPRNEDITVTVGNAFDIPVNHVTIDKKRISDDVTEVYYELTLTNRKEINIIVEVKFALGDNWEIYNSNFEWEKIDSRHARCEVPVKSNDKTVVNYMVMYSR